MANDGRLNLISATDRSIERNRRKKNKQGATGVKPPKPVPTEDKPKNKPSLFNSPESKAISSYEKRIGKPFNKGDLIKHLDSEGYRESALLLQNWDQYDSIAKSLKNRLFG